MITKTAEKLLDEIYKDYYNATKTDRDIDYDIENQGVSYSLGGTLAGAAIGGLLGGLNSVRNPKRAALLGVGLGGLGGRIVAEATKDYRKAKAEKDRELAQLLLAKSANDLYDNNKKIEKILKDTHDLQYAQNLATYNNIRHLDPKDAPAYIAMEQYFNRDIDDITGDEYKSLERYNMIDGVVTGALGGGILGSLLKAPNKRNMLGALSGAAIGALVGGTIGKMTSPKDVELSYEEARNRAIRMKDAYEKAIDKKYKHQR